MKILAILLLILSTAAQAQQHAPTAEQCRVDAALWTAQQGTGDLHSALDKISVQELKERAVEMDGCAITAEGKDDMLKYMVMTIGYMAEEDVRQAAFIERHGLKSQFIAEDAQHLGR
jgi:hypothetical protein